MSVLKSIDLPNKEFNSKAELLKELKENKSILVDAKKSQLKNSDSIKIAPQTKDLATKMIDVDDGYVLAVINTTKYMDSHNDVHVNGIWSKTIGDQAGKVYYITDHMIGVDTLIIDKSDLEIFVKDVLWKDLGADYEGHTQALIFKFKEEDVINSTAKVLIEKRKDTENSVRMQYIKIELAIDDDSDDYKEEKAVWDKYISDIANKPRAIEQGYFWAVEEAKIYKEGSMVLAGSNDITPMIYSNKSIEPPSGTQKTEPSDDTQKTKLNINHYI